MKFPYKVVAGLVLCTAMMGSLNTASAFSSQGAKQVALSETQRRDLAQAAAPIKSTSDLQAYFATTGNRATPFSRLSDGARHRFIQSLSFNEKGLTGFSYEDLQAELSPTEIYQLLSLFGAQHLTSSISGAVIKAPLDGASMGSSDSTGSPAPRAELHFVHIC